MSVFKVGGKIFAISSLDDEPLDVSVKSDPEIAEQLTGVARGRAARLPPNKRHWITVTIDGSLDDGFVTDLVQDSYDLVVASLPKKVQAELA